MQTLAMRIARATDRGSAITFASPSGHERVPWARLHDDARAMAAALQSRGVAPGAHVALLGPTSRPLVTAIQATWLAGATVVVLPLPMRLGSIKEFVDQTRRRIESADIGFVVIDAELASFLERSDGDPPFALLHELEASASAYEQPPDDPDALAILQFTSGATADPKGVMLPHGTVAANLDAMTAAVHLTDDDVALSWLPLYHDMGLIGLLATPMTTGTELVLAAPQDFLARPARWMEWMSEFGATITAGPNFAYALAARALGRLDGLDLSRWRLAGNGAEPVDPDTVDAFCAAGVRHGLDPNAAFPVFGMAEATLGVAFPEPGTGMTVDTVDQAVLEHERYAAPADPGDSGARRLAKLGRPVPGLEIRVVDPETGRQLGEREAGELEVRGASVTPGYYRRPDATADAFRDGWLRTGDLAYLAEGELVVCGRLKDVIIVGGRNILPEDVERAVAGVEGVRAGNVVAVAVEGRRGREGVVVVAEAKAEDTEGLRQAVVRRVREAVGLAPQEVVTVRPGTLPKTSSGKLQRALCRTRYLSAALDVI